MSLQLLILLRHSFTPMVDDQLMRVPIQDLEALYLNYLKEKK